MRPARPGPTATWRWCRAGAPPATRSSTPATTPGAPSPLELVAQIRERVDAWRAADYPGVTTVTRQLLEHWHDRGARQHPFYFCQLEAIETLIWWVEAPAALQAGHRGARRRRRVGAAVQQDGHRQRQDHGDGHGHHLAGAQRADLPEAHKDFSRAIFIVAPGLTVKERLQVLLPGPPGQRTTTSSRCAPTRRCARSSIRSRSRSRTGTALMPLKEPERSCVKKGAESDEGVCARRVLGKLASYKDLVVINDEAHHAYRIPADVKVSKKEGGELGIDPEEATRWIEGLDRIHGDAAHPALLRPVGHAVRADGKTNTESGAVRVGGLRLRPERRHRGGPGEDAARGGARRDALPNAQTLPPQAVSPLPRAEVAEDLNRRGAEAARALPRARAGRVHAARRRLARTAAAWQENGHASPPVMLTVCNRTETAARIEHYFDHGDAHWPELRRPSRTLRVDSKVLAKAERARPRRATRTTRRVLQAIVDGGRHPWSPTARKNCARRP
jgi:type III restriction enzyme